MRAIRVARKVGHTAVIKPSHAVWLTMLFVLVIMIDLVSSLCGQLMGRCHAPLINRTCWNLQQHQAPKAKALPKEGFFL